jgi:type II restriction/modification system DNA methylase subunit YeeA
MSIIDFGVEMLEADAALYELPFAHVQREVKPERAKNNCTAYRERWWIHVEPRPAMRAALASLARYIGTARVAKHRLFVFISASTLPDSQVIIIARSDDYYFGVLHSRAHELWALRQGSSLEHRPRYTPTTTFETFPFPWPPGHEPQGDPRVAAIAVAKRLVELRENWLNPAGADAAELKKCTLTNLYNARPTWLANAHAALDAAVAAAYGWSADLSDEEILSRLLALNLERAARQGMVSSASSEEADSSV